MWTVEKYGDKPGEKMGVKLSVGKWHILSFKAPCLIHRAFKVFTRT